METGKCSAPRPMRMSRSVVVLVSIPWKQGSALRLQEGDSSWCCQPVSIPWKQGSALRPRAARVLICVQFRFNPLETGKCSAPIGRMGYDYWKPAVSIPWKQGSALRPDADEASPWWIDGFNPLETGKCSAPVPFVSRCQQKVWKALLPA